MGARELQNIADDPLAKAVSQTDEKASGDELDQRDTNRNETSRVWVRRMSFLVASSLSFLFFQNCDRVAYVHPDQKDAVIPSTGQDDSGKNEIQTPVLVPTPPATATPNPAPTPTPAPTPPQPLAATTTNFVSALSGRCADIQAESLTAGAALIQWDCLAQLNQTFDIVVVNGFNRIIAKHSGQCLDWGMSAADGPVNQQVCDANRVGQRWLVIKNADTTYRVQSSDGAGCLSIAGNSLANLAAYETIPCNPNLAAQKFRGTGLPGAAPLSVRGLAFVDPSLNLVLNGNFDVGLRGWESLGNVDVTEERLRSGQFVARIGAGSGGLSQDIVSSFQAGAAYILTARGRAGDPSDEASVGVRFEDASGRVLAESQQRLTTSENVVRVELSAPVGSARAVVSVWKVSGTGFVTVDDISLALE